MCLGTSLIDTLAQTRQKLLERQQTAYRELVSAILARARQRHGQEYGDFVRTTSINLADYLQATNAAYNVREAERLLDLLLEYRPVTEAQLRQQTPADLQRWRDAEAKEKKVAELKARGDAAQCSPEWLELMLAIERGVQRRPYLQEAVAPYVRPQTPPTRTLSSAEARAALERDWLHQADQHPTPERIRSEIAWARALAERLCTQPAPALARSSRPPRGAPLDFAPELAELAALEQRAASLAGPDPELYFKVRDVKRRIAFRNPLLDFSQVLFVDMPFPQGSEWPHETRHRLGYMAVPGGTPARARRTFPRWRPAAAHASGALARLILAARPLLRRPPGPGRVSSRTTKSPSTSTRSTWTAPACGRLTDGPFDDLDPIYLADDQHIVFSTTRGQYLRPLHAADQRLRARPLRPGRQQPLLHLRQQRARLSAFGDGRRPRRLHALGIHGQAVVARAEALDRPSRRHPGQHAVGQPKRLARPAQGRAQHPRHPARDVHRQRPPRLVLRLGRHHHRRRRLELPARPDQGHRRRHLARMRQRSGGSRRVPALPPQRRVRGLLLALSARANRTSSSPPIAAASSCST